MKIKLNKRLEKARKGRERWQPWFAWYPVKVSAYEYRIFEIVYRVNINKNPGQFWWRHISKEAYNSAKRLGAPTNEI